MCARDGPAAAPQSFHGGERCRRPRDVLPRLDILAGGQLDDEAAIHLAGSLRRGGLERASGPICWSATQAQLSFCELDREQETRSWSDPPFVVGHDEEVPAFGAELEAIVFDAADFGAGAQVIEPQFIGREPEDASGKETEEGPCGEGFTTSTSKDGSRGVFEEFVSTGCSDRDQIMTRQASNPSAMMIDIFFMATILAGDRGGHEATERPGKGTQTRILCDLKCITECTADKDQPEQY